LHRQRRQVEGASTKAARSIDLKDYGSLIPGSTRPEREVEPTGGDGELIEVATSPGQVDPLGTWFIRVVHGVDLRHPELAAEGTRVLRAAPIA
jgi:hypothetical protein